MRAVEGVRVEREKLECIKKYSAHTLLNTFGNTQVSTLANTLEIGTLTNALVTHLLNALANTNVKTRVNILAKF